MLVVGLVGGIGSGKSTASRFFAELGVPIINADHIARELLQTGSLPLQAIKQRFGEDITDASGQLQRNKLRQLIFQNADDLLWLEALLHPLIIAGIKEAIQRQHTPYVIVEIPLLNKLTNQDFLDRILLIDCPEEIRIKRVVQRDHVSSEDVKKIMATQLPQEELLKLADDIIENDQDITQLKEKIKVQHEKYLKNLKIN